MAMKKILLLMALCALTLCACSGDENQKAVERQIKDYPQTTLLDIYKSFFQDKFGPGHIVADTASARAYLRSELESTTRYDAHYFEPAGRGENFYRVSIALIADSIIPFDEYFDAFYASVQDVDPVDVEQWRAEWAQIMQSIKAMNLEMRDFESHEAEIDSLLASGAYAYHHSRDYNRLYHPHYRLMRKDIFLERIKPRIDSTRVTINY